MLLQRRKCWFIMLFNKSVCLWHFELKTSILKRRAAKYLVLRMRECLFFLSILVATFKQIPIFKNYSLNLIPFILLFLHYLFEVSSASLLPPRTQFSKLSFLRIIVYFHFPITVTLDLCGPNFFFF